MAIKYWKGGAQAIAQITTVTWSAYTAGQTYTITINGKAVSYVALASTSTDVVSGLIAAIQSAAEPEFAAMTASGTTSLIFTGNTPGEPTTILASATTGTATVTATQVATGPNHFSNARNWIGDTLPTAGEPLTFANSSYSVLYDIDQSATNFGDVFVDSTFTGDMGLPVQNVNGYREYRPRYLKLGNGASPFSITIGIGNGGQPPRVNIDANGAQVTMRVFGSGNGSADEPPVILNNPGDLSQLDVSGGYVSVAADTSGFLSTLRITPADSQSASQVQVVTADTVAITNIYHAGGILRVLGDVTTFRGSDNSIARFQLAATCDAIITSGGAIVYWESTSNLTGSLTVQSRGTIDFSRNASLKIATLATCFAGGTIQDPLGVVTWLNGIMLDGCSIDEVTINLGRGRTLFTTLVSAGFVMLATTTNDYDLTSLATLLTSTPDPSSLRVCRFMIVLGTVAKPLDGTGGNFEVTIVIDGVLWNGAPDVIALGTETKAVIQTNDFIVPANKTVILKVLSPNAADTDVTVTAILVSE